MASKNVWFKCTILTFGRALVGGTAKGRKERRCLYVIELGSREDHRAVIEVCLVHEAVGAPS